MQKRLLPRFAVPVLRFAVILQITAIFFSLTSPVAVLAQEEETTTKPRTPVIQAAEVQSPSDKSMKKDLVTQTDTVLTVAADAPKWWQAPNLTGNWGGLRARLEDKGISFSGEINFDSSRGGNNDLRSASRGLVDLQLTFDLGKLAGLEGGTVAVQYYTLKGRSGAGLEDHIQSFSNIDADRFSRVAEVWYEQWLFKRRARLKVGRVDANSEFAFVEHGGEFINASMGYSPTIFTLPTYPTPMNSVNLFVYPTKNVYGGVGVYDSKGTGAFVIAEGGATWSLGSTSRPGRAGLGVWRQTGGVDRFSGDRQAHTSGFYVIADQTLWRGESKSEDHPRRVNAFFQYGQSDANISAVCRHIGGGIAWTGAISGRDADVLGIGPTWIRVSDQPGAGFSARGELALEAFYKIQLTPWLSVKPDFQYMRTPGGANSFKRAALGTVRFTFSF